MPVRTALEALALRPAVLLRSSWPWRSLAYLAGGALVGLATIAAVVALMVAGTLLSVLVVGIAGYVAVLLSGIVVARIERARLRLVDLGPDVPPADPHRPPPRAGLRAWVVLRLREPVTWRELGYAALNASLLWWMDALVLAGVAYLATATFGSPWFNAGEPLAVRLAIAAAGIPLVLVMAYPVTAWAGARAVMARVMLTPPDDARLVEVTRSRARLVDAFEVERRRIERDLHDGAQQRLVALSMQLGLARLEVPPASPAAESLAAAHELAKQALTDLRELIRGVHPKVLTDRGLAAAVGEAASTAPLPVDLDLRLPGRLSGAVEVTAYFVVVEALTNVAKHSAATRAAVTAFLDRDRLVVEVRDDGRGGADPGRGSGLVGLADRVAVLDGTVTLASPAGGPTLLRVEIPAAAAGETP